MLTKNELILAKVETHYNIDAAPTAADNAILVEDRSFSNEGARLVERNVIRSRLSKPKHIYAGHLVKLDITTELKGSGAPGVPPEIGPLLRACGLAEIIQTDESVHYLPASLNHESVTIYYYHENAFYKATGCRGNVSFNLEAGNIGKANFTLTGRVTQFDMATGGGENTIQFPDKFPQIDGLFNDMEIELFGGTGVGQARKMISYDGATRTATLDRNWDTVPDSSSAFKIFNYYIDRPDLPLGEYDDTAPRPLIAVPFSIDNYAAVINSLSFDLSNTVSASTSLFEPEGYAEVRITDRDVQGSFDPEAVPTAVHDFYKHWRQGKEMELDTGVIGSEPGNRYRIRLPHVYYRDVSTADRDGVRVFDVPFGAAEGVGDDEIEIVFQ